MDSKFNFDLLFKKTESLDFREHPIFKKTALSYHVDKQKDLKGFSEQDIQLFKKHAFQTGEGIYRLNNADRLEILKNHIGKENIPSAIKTYNAQGEFADVLEMAARSNRIDIQKLSNKELYYAIILAEIYPEVFSADACKGLYQRRQFFKQFERITKNFAGRKKELNVVNDYVDWLPPKTLVNKLYSGFRNIISWYEKPPLLVKGIGGIGKSTIVAKFIMDQNTSGKGNLPFVYIDFDLQGFSLKEPMIVLIEALRQIKIQFPQHNQLLDRINEQISELIETSESEGFAEGHESATKVQGTTQSSRTYIYERIEEIIKGNNLDFGTIGRRPILVVFDSFEEMQYRASDSELFTFYTFIKEISEKLPRVRPIFVGRAELDIGTRDISFETLEINDFDPASANALLLKSGIEDQKTRGFIYENFGGNPLMLTLATDLAKKEGFDLKNPEKIKGQKWQYLVRRILGHIHDDEVRKVAVPGMLVRFVNPEVIQKVIAGPTQLEFVDENKAHRIYEALKREVSLISKSDDGRSFSFRQDLRMTCEPMILEKYKKESEEIRENAIRYYGEYTSVKDPITRLRHQAEYYFHLLKKEQIPEDLDVSTYVELRPYLEQSIIELPPSSQRFINSLIHKKVNGTSEMISDEEWERNSLGPIQEALNGEPTYLQEQYEHLRKRKSRTNKGFSEFGKYEAQIYQRLGKISRSNTFIAEALSNRNHSENDNLYIEFKLIEIQNLEYEERYQDALDLCEKLDQNAIEVNIKSRLKYDFLYLRIESRIHETNVMERLQEFTPKKFDIAFNEDGFRDTKWEFIYNELNPESAAFQNHKDFNQRFRSAKREFRNLTVLERYAQKNTGLFLKDITLTGTFEIVLRDYLCALEISQGELS